MSWTWSCDKQHYDQVAKNIFDIDTEIIQLEGYELRAASVRLTFYKQQTER